MGWTYTHKDKGITIKDFFTKEFSGENGEVIDCAVVERKTAYIAYRGKKGRLEGKVTAFICLLGYSKDYYNFGYKDMDETMGAYEAKCPERILNLLSPVEEFGLSERGMEYASEWRKSCWENINKKKTAVTLKDGDIVHFEKAIHFTNGDNIQDFKVKKEGKKVRFESIGKYWQKYQITNWKDREFTIIPIPFQKEA